MMQTLANILPPAHNESLRNRNAELPSHLSRRADESFDALMSRALKPAAPGKQSSPASDRPEMSPAHDPESRKPISRHHPQPTPPSPNKTPHGKNQVEARPDRPALPTDSALQSDEIDDTIAGSQISDKSADSLGMAKADEVPGNPQFTPSLLLAPAPTISLLNPNTPTDGSTETTTESSVSLEDTAAANHFTLVDGSTKGGEAAVKQTVTGAMSALATEEQMRRSNTANSPAAPKIKPSEAKTSESTAAGVTALNIKPAEAAGRELASQMIPGGAADAADPLTSPEAANSDGTAKAAEASEAFQIHGTPAAKQEMSMKKQDNTNKVAGSGEQVLPGGVAASTPDKVLPARGNFVVSSAAGAATADTTAAANSLNLGQTLTATGSSAGSLVSSNLIDLPARALERTHDMVALHALRVVDIKSDSLQVVIKPGAGIQLALELRQRDDGIEARAILQQGDFNQLNLHWTDLQQRLEQRGIRLAPLTGEDNAVAFGGGNEFQHKQQRPPEEQDPLAAGAFADYALATAMSAPAGRPTPYAVTPRGWQTWA